MSPKSRLAPEKQPTIGVLAVQGAFHLHQKHIEAAGGKYREVLTPADLDGLDGLILPGGESGVMLKLLDSTGMTAPLARFIAKKPVWGICAGAILLARKVSHPAQKTFAALDIEIRRNAYGRQLESSEETIDGYTVAYIRAPKIVKTGVGARILHKKKSDPVWVEQGRTLVTTFHPEVNAETPSPWHARFVKLATGNMAGRKKHS